MGRDELSYVAGDGFTPVEVDTRERPPRVCDACGGDGGWDAPHGVDYRDGSLLTHWQPCACGGSGEVEDDSVLIDEEDLP